MQQYPCNTNKVIFPNDEDSNSSTSLSQSDLISVDRSLDKQVSRKVGQHRREGPRDGTNGGWVEAKEVVHCKRGLCERTVWAQQSNPELSHNLACSVEPAVVGQWCRPETERNWVNVHKEPTVLSFICNALTFLTLFKGPPEEATALLSFLIKCQLMKVREAKIWAWRIKNKTCFCFTRFGNTEDNRQ